MCSSSAAPIRDRFQAWLINELDSVMHSAYGQRKQLMFADHPDEIVEIGPGAGANFRYYRPGTRVIAIEPNAKMHARLRQRAARHRLDLEVLACGAESIPLRDESANTVVGTLVLCSVEDPVGVLAEVHRVLGAGGRFVFLEHVAEKRKSSFVAIQQRLLRRPWKSMFAGCRIDQDTLSLIEASPFDALAFEGFALAYNVLPFSPHISGAAVK